MAEQSPLSVFCFIFFTVDISGGVGRFVPMVMVVEREEALGRVQLLCDGTGAETSFRLSVEWTSPCILAGGDSSVRYWQPWCAR
jgi:hypothetical protein